MADLGEPTSYLALATGVGVFSADGERIGTIEEIYSDEDEDIFDGLVIGTGDGRRFVEAAQVDSLYENGAVLKLPADAAKDLPGAS